MRAVLLLAGKDLRLLVRDRVGFFFAFVWPLIFAVFFGSVFSGPREGAAPKIAWVDRDASPGSVEFLAAVRADLDVVEVDLERARDLVRRGEVAAYVALPEGFGAARRRMFFGSDAALEVGIDPSRKAESAMIEGILMRRAFEGFRELFDDPDRRGEFVKEALAGLEEAPGVNPAFREHLQRLLESWKSLPMEEAGGGAFEPLRIDTSEVRVRRPGPANAYAISFPQGIIWGIMACAAGFGISMVTERVRGTLVRLQTAPLWTGHVLAGKAAACLAATAGVATALLVLARAGFGVVPNSVPLLAAAVLCVSLCFVGIMVFLSVLGRTEAAAGGIGWAVLMVMAMFGGGMVPYLFLPEWMRAVGNVSPVKWSILAMEGAIWRGFSAGEMAGPCAALLGMGALFFLAGARAFRKF
jgi:ABC-2 type transport system permease protein